MRVLIPRVQQAQVDVAGLTIARIEHGLLLLVGVAHDDGPADISWLVHKIVNLRLFADDAGVMNRSLLDIDGSALAVSQFTLLADVKKGNRPSWGNAAPGAISQPFFADFVAALSQKLSKNVPTGEFGADMQVSLVNDGPVTIWLDSKDYV